MRRINVNYSIRDNFGNALNPFIFEKVLGYGINWASPNDCEMTAIGSGLRLMYVTQEKLNKLKTEGKYHDNNTICCLWSSGYLNTPTGAEIPVRSNVHIAMVRGELSRRALEKTYNVRLNIPTADAGLLASEIITKQTKKYYLGIIPHIRECDEVEYQDLCKITPRSIMIDVRESPIRITEKIAQCHCIVSSSLHGLVVADSLGVPNKRVVLTNNILGDGFKFDDYYSSFGVTSDYIDLRKTKRLNIDEIMHKYQITESQVSLKKHLIMDSFREATSVLSM